MNVEEKQSVSRGGARRPDGWNVAAGSLDKMGASGGGKGVKGGSPTASSIQALYDILPSLSNLYRWSHQHALCARG